jgi:general stress protein 26
MQRSTREERVTPDLVLRELRRHNFAVLSTVAEDGTPSSAGVNYGVTAPGKDLALYIMTRRQLRKARNIARNPRVSLVVPLPRRVLQFVPPATIQLSGTAEILDWTHKEGIEVFRRFWMGLSILEGYAEARRRGETRICFLRITLDPIIRTYAVGYSAWELRRNMESAAATVHIPPEYLASRR